MHIYLGWLKFLKLDIQVFLDEQRYEIQGFLAVSLEVCQCYPWKNPRKAEDCSLLKVVVRNGQRIKNIVMSEFQVWQLLVYGLLVLALIVVMMSLSFVLGERRTFSRPTRQPYESGILPTHTPDIRVPVQFYLMAMFFVIFDVEAVFIFAWAIAVPEAGWLGFWEMTLFIGILFVALVYLWRIGALDWGPDLERVRSRMASSRLSSKSTRLIEEGVKDCNYVRES